MLYPTGIPLHHFASGGVAIPSLTLGPGAREHRSNVILAGGCKNHAAPAGFGTVLSLGEPTAFDTFPAQESRTVNLTAYPFGSRTHG